MNKISVFGLGKLGLPMLAVFADKGFEVVGYDVSNKVVEAVNICDPPVIETGLNAMLRNNRQSFRATNDVQDAIDSSDVSFVIVPTPSGKDALFDNKFVLACLQQIGAALKNKSDYHLIVITSTVVPGSMDNVIKPALERASGKTIGDNLGLCYNPEFIALGTVIKDMLNPDILLIGQSDETAGDLLESVYAAVVNGNPVTHRLNFVEAEISKIAVNTFVTTKISYANMLADICYKLGNANVDNVTNAIGDDRRIGRKYLKGGVAYGGPCFPRDNKAFCALGDKLGVNTALAQSTDAINDYQAERLVDIVKEACNNTQVIGVLGCSFKPATPIFEESPGIALMKILSNQGFHGLFSDECCKPPNVNGFCFQKDYLELISECDCIIIMTEHSSYKDIPSIIANTKYSGKIIIDPWRFLQGDGFPAGVTYVTPGFKKGQSK